uniref:CD160 antigen n=1 Tax=Castor canadensis TaxID=51338 RepID=A0A8B7UYB4_CASCN|nr:CD160 antigen isoform X1 [Castor canadensis]
MALGQGCYVLAILLVIVDIQFGVPGYMHITSSVSQEGKRLNLICTLWYKNDEAEGLIIFLCKDKLWNCFPETSLEQLRLKRDPGIDGVNEKSSQLVFTINQATTLDSGTYQCCARSQKLNIYLQGHFFSVLVTETGNYTVTGLKEIPYPESSHKESTSSSGFLEEKSWVVLVISLMTLQGTSRIRLSAPTKMLYFCYLGCTPEEDGQEAQRERKMSLKP